MPTLRHLWDTAPYLHDGRAKTLREVRTLCKPDDGLGNTHHLTEQGLDDLIRFLLRRRSPVMVRLPDFPMVREMARRSSRRRSDADVRELSAVADRVVTPQDPSGLSALLAGYTTPLRTSNLSDNQPQPGW